MRQKFDLNADFTLYANSEKKFGMALYSRLLQHLILSMPFVTMLNAKSLPRESQKRWARKS